MSDNSIPTVSQNRINSTVKFLSGLVGLTMLIVASRQLFMFMTLRSTQDLAVGRYHLWLAIGAAIVAGGAGGLMFRTFSASGRNTDTELNRAPLRRTLTGPSENILNHDPVSFEPTRWTFINAWQVSEQAHDRTPQNGGVLNPPGSSAAQRSTSRRSRQVGFKEWSQVRHD